MIITMDKKYRTKSGVDVTILRTDLKNNDFPVLGTLINEDGVELIRTYTINGRWNNNTESLEHLVEVSPYEDFKIDDKVLVWNGTGPGPEKYKRHFAGLDKDGYPMAFKDGTTSFSTNSIRAISWDNCELFVG